MLNLAPGEPLALVQEVAWACERFCRRDKQARDPILCTLTSLGTCIKNDKEQTALIPLIQIL
jgi:hypothetical protein